jgi:hypothetical protein
MMARSKKITSQVAKDDSFGELFSNLLSFPLCAFGPLCLCACL